jgi:predicted phosphate transport protein (TIGR00153 family)
MFKLIHKDIWFFEHFNDAAKGVHDASVIFVELLQNDNESSLISSVQRIKELEHEGDKITHKVVDHLNKSFLTPYDREDIYLLITRLDDVMDMLDGAASRVLHWRIGAPPTRLKSQVKVLENAATELHMLVQCLQPSLSYTHIHKHFERIHQLENEGDQIQREALFDLFENEKDPIRVIKLKEIHEFVETAIDKCEDVANVIEGICVKHA